ncbi:MAG TPA: hypothetical protein VHZ07_08460 [Bryobacteraceae bacterium]|jgi:hypothetical protein|nr:hypothetical protein [Bryobacteraceae bacterium]
MRKRANSLAKRLFFDLFAAAVFCTQIAAAADIPVPVISPGTSYSALSNTLLDRAESEAARIKTLVDNGILPKSRLEQAQSAVADAQDETILARTLYGATTVQDMTPAGAQAMIEAAQRRVDRETQLVAERRNLLDHGILSKSEFSAFQDELENRRRTLDLAHTRANLLDQLRQMAAAEREAERSAAQTAAAQTVMIRYDGNGLFNLNDMVAISEEFDKRFHEPLPISAWGQTLVHQALGLDHRNRVDVALNPDRPEGIWLRHFLESERIPYIAFRSAVPGAATAPHIHLGPESTRLKLAQR